MKTVLHKAETRGHANHGWLNSYHTFSFANYYNPERMHFGALRVLNDDTVEPGMGFGTHPHDNMEIISIPLEGDLEHKDSMGNTTVIRHGEVQVMSAGTGIMHSEYNHSKEHPVKFLQIWVFPNVKDVTPRYDQISISELNKENKLFQILSPDKEDDGVWIYQDAWFTMGYLNAGFSENYILHKEENGVYAFLIDGEAEIAGHNLKSRDGLGISGAREFSITVSQDAHLLLMEVPM